MRSSPGSGPRALAWRRRGRRLLLSGTALGVAVAGFVVDAVWVGVAGCLIAVAAWRAHAGSIARADAGAEAERRVARVLRRAHVTAVEFGVRLPGHRGDIDAMLLGPVAAVIEVKRGAGRVVVRPDGTARSGRRGMPGNPGRQVLSAASAVRRLAGEIGRVDAVLCVTDMRQRPKTVLVDGIPVTVCSARHLRRVVARLDERLSPDETERVLRRLGDLSENRRHRPPNRYAHRAGTSSSGVELP